MKHIIAVISISLLFSQAPSNAKYTRDQGHGMDTAPGPDLSRDRNDFSLEFDGISNNVDCGSDSILGLTDQITIEGWVRPTAIDGWDAILNKGTCCPMVGYYLGINPVGNTLRWNIGLGAIDGDPMVVDEWVHVAAVFDGATMRTYQNGVETGSVAAPGTISLTTSNLKLASQDANDYTFHGRMDDFRVWGTALTQQQIQEHMSAELTGSEEGLVGYWNFNEGAGDTLNDLTPNGNSGLISGAEWSTDVPFQGELTMDQASVLPTRYVLHQNHPNPFNPVTTLTYDLPKDASVSILIHDMMGGLVRTLVHARQRAGHRSVRWDATDDTGAPISAGLYLYTIQTKDLKETRKMVLLK